METATGPLGNKGFLRGHLGFSTAMPCERIWECETFRSSEEGYFDHELVLAAASGEYNEMKTFMVVSKEPQRDQEGDPETSNAHRRASQITGTVQWLTENCVRNCSTVSMGLYAASLCGRETVVQLLLDDYKVSACATIEIDGVNRTALVAAVKGGHEKVVQLLLDNGADVNTPAGKYHGRTALQAAAEGGHEKVVQLLLDRNADVNAPAADVAGRTALQAAAEGGHLEVVQVLLGRGADVNAPAGWGGRTALQAAAEGGHERVVQLLLDHKANVNAPAAGDTGGTALQAAAQGGHEEVVQVLLGRGADVNAPAEWGGRTALQAAAEGGHEKVVQFLLDHKADVNVPAAIDIGRTALRAAAEGGHEKVVQLLLDHKADVNAPVAGYAGRTALRAAAEGGHEKVVQLLLDHKADVNAPAAKYAGRTALQAAAEGGNQKVVQLLLDHKADVNAPSADDTGRTALQAAAEGGHEKLVQLLLDHKADVNAPAADVAGRTALQAAAEGGHEKVVQLLLDHKADVNAPAAEDAGRTALQAAAEGGHEKVVQLLLDHKADVNAPAAEDAGRTALQAAAEGGHEKVVQLLLVYKADVNAPVAHRAGRTALQAAAEGRYWRVQVLLLLSGADFSLSAGSEGQNFLHYVCTPDRAHMLPELLKNSSPQIVSARDHSGSSPLHLAVRNGLLECVQLLLTKGANKEIQDTFGNTPLPIALDIRNSSIFKLLLGKGARTDTIPTSKYLKWLDDQRRNNSDHDCILISDHPTDGRNITGTRWSGEKITSFRDLLKRRSILFQRSNQLKVPEPTAYRGTCLGLPRYRDWVSDSPGSLVRCMWATTKKSAPDDVLNFVPGIPNNQEILSLGLASVVLIGHACFIWPSGHSLKSPAGSSSSPTFQAGTQKVEIAWVMSNKNDTMALESNKPMRFVHYRGTFSLKLLAIPRHGVEFVTWFLREINSRWVELIGSSKSHLAQRRSSQLQAAGGNPMIIGFLLRDSQEWYRLRQIWREHYDKSCDLLRQFEEHDIFRIISTDHDFTTTHYATAQGAHTNATNELNKRKKQRGTQNRPLIESLRDQVKYHREDCGQALSELDRETKELIELEFNLVSIFEARSSLKMAEVSIEMAKRSIEMAKVSNEMARSMKRLSWITFIFLPLMFISGLFGMNVNVLSDNPAWQWYFIVAGPFSACVIIISLLCKYLPITDFMKGIDERLQLAFSTGISSSTTANGTSDHRQVPTGKEFLNNQESLSRMSGLRRRPVHVNDLESARPVDSRTPILQQ